MVANDSGSKLIGDEHLLRKWQDQSLSKGNAGESETLGFNGVLISGAEGPCVVLPGKDLWVQWVVSKYPMGVAGKQIYAPGTEVPPNHTKCPTRQGTRGTGRPEQTHTQENGHLRGHQTSWRTESQNSLIPIPLFSLHKT